MKRILYIGNKLSEHGFTPTSIETLGPLLESEGYGVLYASSQRNTFNRFLDMVGTVIKYRKQTDFILIDTYSTTNFWYAYGVGVLAKLFNIPYIPILHGGDLPTRLNKNPRLCRQLFGKAYMNVAPSHYLFQVFKDFGIKNIQFIPNIIELENYPIFPKKYDIPHLLWVRSFASIYNPKMAIDVLELVKKQFPQTTLTMVGPDKDGSLIEAKKYALDKNIQINFTGRLSKKDWIELSKTHNVFINTTNFDNTPISVMEAMALGFPVVSTSVGGIPYLLENNKDAVLVEKDDTQAMADAIISLCNEKEWRDRIIYNAVSKSKSWDWQQVKKQWNILLKKSG